MAAALAPRASGSSTGASVIPHYDAWPEPLSALIALQAPRGSLVLGIDEETAVVGRDGAWQVHGRSASRSGAAAIASASRGEIFRLSRPASRFARRCLSPAGPPVASRGDVGQEAGVGRAATLDRRSTDRRQSGLTVRKQSEQ